MINDKQKTLLLVEDEAVIAVSKKKLLERNGYKIITAATGEQAVKIAENENDISLILMDIDLGKGIDGTAAAQMILERKEIPVVFMSSHSEKEIVEKTDRITSYGYVVKNSGDTVLIASINMAFRLFESRMNELEKERKLQESGFFFKESQRAARIGSYKTDFISGYWKSSEVLDCIFGIGEDYTRSIKGWADIIHPDDRERMIKYLNDDVIEKKRPFNMEYRIIRMNDHAERWVHGLGAVESDESGRVISLIGTIQDITERKNTEFNLRKSETVLRHILDTIPQSVFWKDRDSVYLGCNRAFADVAGIGNPDEITGKTDFDLSWPKLDAESYRADDAYVINNRTSKSHIIETVRLPDGRDIWVDKTKIPLLDYDGSVYGILGVFEDITERKLADEKIRINEDRYRKLFMYSPNGIVIADRESYYLDVNPAMCRMLGYTREEFIGLHASDIVIQPEIPYIEPALNVIRSNKNYHREWSFLRKDGSVLIAEVDASTMPDGNLIGIINDISERKKAEDEIRQLLQEKTVLLKEVHHRIKNNIASIEGLLQLHMETAGNPETVSALQDAVGRVASLRVLYEKLLVSEDFRDTSIKTYIETLVDAILSLFPENLKITCDLDIDEFNVSPGKLFPLGIIINEVFTNIMKYAFTGKDSGIINVVLTNMNNKATLIIQDNGNGLPEGFDLGRTGGFGLMLAGMLSEQMGGTINLKNSNGTRCTLEFEI